MREKVARPRRKVALQWEGPKLTRAPEVNQHDQDQIHNLWSPVQNGNVGSQFKKQSYFKWHSLWLWIHRFSQQILIKHLLCAIASSMHYWCSREHNRAMSPLSQTRLCRALQVFIGTLTMTDVENHWRIWERSNMTWLMFPKNNLPCGK